MQSEVGEANTLLERMQAVREEKQPVRARGPREDVQTRTISIVRQVH